MFDSNSAMNTVVQVLLVMIKLIRLQLSTFRIIVVVYVDHQFDSLNRVLFFSFKQIIASIMHEIGHTLGYIHTQSRIDRNSYVTIVTANIDSDYLSNFYMWYYGTIQFSDVNFPYDFGSFMHYQPYGFSNNGEKTIESLDILYERTFGQRERAAFYDYKAINRLYCTRTGN